MAIAAILFYYNLHTFYFFETLLRIIVHAKSNSCQWDARTRNINNINEHILMQTK